ncbi:MAG: hypothetical protein V3U45_03750 [bacterium]
MKRVLLVLAALLVAAAVAAAVILSGVLTYTGMLRQDPITLEFVDPDSGDPFFTLNNGTLRTVTFLAWNSRDVTTEYVLNLTFAVTAGDASAAAPPLAQLREYKGINRTLAATVNLSWTPDGPLSWTTETATVFNLGSWEPADWELDLTFTFTGSGDFALRVSAWEP